MATKTLRLLDDKKDYNLPVTAVVQGYTDLEKVFGKGNLFGINGIDIKSYYMGMNNTRWSDTTKVRIPADLKPEVKHTHNALQDAIEQAKLFENMLRTKGTCWSP